MLRCSVVAQREAARQRREAYTQFAGIFSTEVRLRRRRALPRAAPARARPRTARAPDCG